MKRTLQAVGVLALFGWTALGVLAWWALAGRIEITVREDEANGDENLALLDDRLDRLSGDLDALVATLDRNFEQLAAADAERESTRAAERARLEQRLAALESALPAAAPDRATTDALAAVLARHEALADTPATADSGGAPPVAAPPPSAAPADPVAPALAPAEPEPAAGEPEPARSFLAFRLPSRDFRFVGPQDFELLADLSRVGFDAKSTLHDFSGVSNRVHGGFRVDLADADAGIAGRVAIDTGSLGTGLEGRDEAMLDQLAADRFAELAFVPTGFATAEVNADELRLTGILRGELTIRGVTRSVRLDVRTHVDESRRLVVEGELPLRLGDYGIDVPDKLGVIKVDDEVRVWIHLRARARPPEVGR